MRFKMTCLDCGHSGTSPEGRDAEKFQEFLALIAEMGLVCKECGGEIVGSEVK